MQIESRVNAIIAGAINMHLPPSLQLNKPTRAINFSDLTGQTFGRIQVIEFAGKVQQKNYTTTKWLCLCSCGATKELASHDLKRGKTNSCGCLRKEIAAKRATAHGGTGTDEYEIWKGIRSRCFNKNTAKYSAYKDRAPDDRWNTFDQFLQDMGPRPSKLHSIDRIDNSQPYSKENCRWATPSEQSRNTSRTIFFTHDGKTMCLADWAELVAINYSTLHSRIKKGWSLDAAINTPVRSKKP